MQPTLTIIIPTYNSATYVFDALNSILSQTFQDFEIFVIDGGSTDETLAKVKNFSKKDNRIQYISEPDLGIYDAMNKGILLANGYWLYFLGSDDILLNNNVLEIIFSNNNGSADIIYGNVISTRFNGRYDGEFTLPKIFEKNICHQAIFFKKRVFKITGNFNLRYVAHADYDHNLKWFLNKKLKKKYLPIDIAKYADGGFSSVSNDNKFYREKRAKFLKYSLNSEKNIFILNLAKEEFKFNLRRRNYKGLIIPAIVSIKQILNA